MHVHVVCLWRMRVLLSVLPVLGNGWDMCDDSPTDCLIGTHIYASCGGMIKHCFGFILIFNVLDYGFGRGHFGEDPVLLSRFDCILRNMSTWPCE